MNTVTDLVRVRDTQGRIHHVSRADLEDVDRIRFNVPLRMADGTLVSNLPRYHLVRSLGTTIHRENIADVLDD